jgi:hypothetical protein
MYFLTMGSFAQVNRIGYPVYSFHSNREPFFVFFFFFYQEFIHIYIKIVGTLKCFNMNPTIIITHNIIKILIKFLFKVLETHGMPYSSIRK